MSDKEPQNVQKVGDDLLEKMQESERQYQEEKKRKYAEAYGNLGFREKPVFTEKEVRPEVGVDPAKPGSDMTVIAFVVPHHRNAEELQAAIGLLLNLPPEQVRVITGEDAALLFTPTEMKWWGHHIVSGKVSGLVNLDQGVWGVQIPKPPAGAKEHHGYTNVPKMSSLQQMKYLEEVRVEGAVKVNDPPTADGNYLKLSKEEWKELPDGTSPKVNDDLFPCPEGYHLKGNLDTETGILTIGFEKDESDGACGENRPGGGARATTTVQDVKDMLLEGPPPPKVDEEWGQEVTAAAARSCGYCDGTGKIDGPDGKKFRIVKPCPVCGGKGSR